MKRIGWVIPIIFFSVCIVGLFSYQNKQQITSPRAISVASSDDLTLNTWSNSATDISQVTYSVNDKLIYAKRSEDSWYLPDFENRFADSGYIYNLITPFLNPVLNNPTSVSSDNLLDYGIDNLSPKLKLYTNSGDMIEVVKGNPFDNYSDYVYIPSTETIYTMSNNAFSSLTVSPDKWLSKEILDFDESNVSQVNLVYKGHAATLTPVNIDDGTTFDSNQFDEKLSNEFVTFLKGLHIDKFITSNNSEHILNEYGFNTPVLDCTIDLKDGNTLSLVIGDINETEDICYAKVNDGEEIVTIPYFSLSQFNTLYTQFQEEKEKEEKEA